MTVTVNLPPEAEEAFRAEAQAKGVPVDDGAVVGGNSWRIGPIPTLFPDEAMERESIHGDHGR